MKLRINAHPEVFEECPVITADILVDLKQVGAEQCATNAINALRSGLNVYNRLTVNEFVDLMKKQPSSIIGVSLEWIK